ncbi:1683_t:CDS:2 [Entrophospora sp. SA101]|nr:1683_t:CDS:2 [Entrophospora sp. SA101]
MDYTIEQGKVIINYVLVVKATPSGIVFKFQSGEVAPPISPLFKIGGALAGGAIGGPAGAAAGSAAGSAMAGSGDDKEKPISVELNRGIGEAMGFTSVKGGKATEEQHTSRMVEQHNNNANPTTYPLEITFEKLGTILRSGKYKGELDLDYDPNGRMAECFARSVTFYEDKKKHFVKPDLGLSQQLSTSVYSLGGIGDTYIAQAITTGGEGITVDIPYTADQRGYSHTTYIKLTNSNVMDAFRDALVSGTPNLTFGHYNSNQAGFANIKFTPSADCSVILKLDVNSPGTKDLDLKSGTEYEVTINQSQFIFKGQGTTRGGETEIPLSDPEVNIPEPGENDPTPDLNLPEPDLLDPTGGEPEIPTIEPDIPPDIDPNDPGIPLDIDPPPIEPDPPEIDPNDPDTGRDPETGGPDLPPPDLGDDDDDAD